MLIAAEQRSKLFQHIKKINRWAHCSQKYSKKIRHKAIFNEHLQKNYFEETIINRAYENNKKLNIMYLHSIIFIWKVTSVNVFDRYFVEQQACTIKG